MKTKIKSILNIVLFFGIIKYKNYSHSFERTDIMLHGKTVLLGVSGSIAAYKIAGLCSMLKKSHADVHVIMTKNACQFINPITFESLTGNKCLIDTFDRNFEFQVEHVAIAKKADIVLIAPASANIIAKLAHGIADDMLSTTVLACKCKKLLAPAMNTNMYENEIVQDNIKILQRYGFDIISPDTGYLACGDIGTGKMVSEGVLYDYITKEIAYEKDMTGLNVLVTAGPTCETIDPVRYITNHSSGKMGYAMANMAMMRGANITLVTGKTNLEKPKFMNVVQITSAKEMFEAVTTVSDNQDIIIKAAAVADYRPKTISTQKIKKTGDTLSLEMERTDDILAYLGENKKQNQFLCGFAMETEDMVSNSIKKLEKKNLDMIAANNLFVDGAGFGVDTNVLTVITKNEHIQLEQMTKLDAAKTILDMIIERR